MLLARNRDFRLFFSAAGISNLGDGISALAFPWLATLLTRDPFLIGAVAAAGRLPWLLFALPAGVITDRMDRQTLMVRADIFRMVLTFFVVALVLSAPPLPLADGAEAFPMVAGLALAAFLLGTAEVFRDNAAQTALPQVVEPRDLEAANGQIWSVEQVMGQFIGPPLAGFLIAWSVPLPFVFDALTFGIAALLVWMLTMKGVVPAPRAGFRREFMEGARWLKNHRLILTFAIMLSVLNFVTFGSHTILVLLGQEVLGLSATGYGLILSAGAGGAVLGSLLGPGIAARLGGRGTILLAVFMFIPAFAAIGLSNSAVLTGAALALMWAFGMVWNIVTVSLRQRVIPPALLGRVNAIYRFFGWGSIPLGSLAAGALVTFAEPGMGREAALRLPFLVAAGVTVALLAFAVLCLRFDDTSDNSSLS